jgi:hypothetical protein
MNDMQHQQWQYQVIHPKVGWSTEKWEGESIGLELYLNKKGREGWELVQGPSHQYNCCIFKRPKTI